MRSAWPRMPRSVAILKKKKQNEIVRRASFPLPFFENVNATRSSYKNGRSRATISYFLVDRNRRDESVMRRDTIVQTTIDFVCFSACVATCDPPRSYQFEIRMS